MIGGETVMAELDPAGHRTAYRCRVLGKGSPTMDDDLRASRGRLRGFSINRLIPNVLTLAALCSGLTAIRFGLQGQMRLAVIAIIVAAIFDALDGRVARRLGVTQPFRRRARFAVRLPVLRRGTGTRALSRLVAGRGIAGLDRGPDVPDLLGAASGTVQHGSGFRHAATGLDGIVLHRRAGAGAARCSALMPLMVSFEIEAAWPRHALVVGIVLVVVGGLMVSRVPTFSFKKGRVPRHLVLPALLGAALVMTVIASSPWIGLSLLGLGYTSP